MIDRDNVDSPEVIGDDGNDNRMAIESDGDGDEDKGIDDDDDDDDDDD